MTPQTAPYVRTRQTQNKKASLAKWLTIVFFLHISNEVLGFVEPVKAKKA